MKLDHTPQFAFGIKHSPYIGTLKGDAWGGTKSEAVGIASRTLGRTIESGDGVNVVAVNGVAMVNGGVSSNAAGGGGGKSSSTTTTTKTTNLANGGTRTETTTVTKKQFSAGGSSSSTSFRTRVHADGHRIRSETFTSKGGAAASSSSSSAVTAAAANAVAKVAASRAAEVKAIA